MRTYQHTAYWYALHEGRTYSENDTWAGGYFDMHSRRGRWVTEKTWTGKTRQVWKPTEVFDDFNPVIFGACIMLDIGIAMRDELERLADPDERAKMANDLKYDLRVLRRPLYYARETARRRKLALERRKVRRRTTLAPKPTPELVLAAWKARNTSKENMIRLGGVLQDLECYVDNCLRYDGAGNVIGRNGGIRGWIAENLPELNGKYKTLMRYKAMAIKLRQVTNTRDPVPTARLLDAPRSKLVLELIQDLRKGFSSLDRGIRFHLDPETVLKEKDELEVEERVWKRRAKLRKYGRRKFKLLEAKAKRAAEVRAANFASGEKKGGLEKLKSGRQKVVRRAKGKIEMREKKSRGKVLEGSRKGTLEAKDGKRAKIGYFLK